MRHAHFILSHTIGAIPRDYSVYYFSNRYPRSGTGIERDAHQYSRSAQITNQGGKDKNPKAIAAAGYSQTMSSCVQLICRRPVLRNLYSFEDLAICASFLCSVHIPIRPQQIPPSSRVPSRYYILIFLRWLAEASNTRWHVSHYPLLIPTH